MKNISAQCAKEIRKILKKQFPNTKFSVRSKNFSMGNSVDVEYNDSIPTDQVEKAISHYQYGHFNSLEDMYENTNVRDDIPQVKFVSIQRDISKENRESLLNYINSVTNFDLDEHDLRFNHYLSKTNFDIEFDKSIFN